MIASRRLRAAIAVWLAAVSLVVGACAPRPRPAVHPAADERALLNSERIERRFGSYGVEVLESGPRVRVSNLFSLEDGRRVCRTLAVVVFASATDPRVAAEHAEIHAGGSIGAVFKAHGWTVEKRQRLLDAVPTRPADRVLELMRLHGLPMLALDVYDFTIRRGDERIPYATIAEVYHPDYLRLEDLRVLVGADLDAPNGGGAIPSDGVPAIVDLVRRAIASPLAVEGDADGAHGAPYKGAAPQSRRRDLL